MMKFKRIYSLLYIISFITFLLFCIRVTPSSPVFASTYACSSGYYCTHTTQYYDGWYDANTGPLASCWPLSGIRNPYYWNCSGTDESCTDDAYLGGFYYPTEDDCKNGTNGAVWGCCIPEGGDSCTPTTCNPVGFTSCETDVGSGWTQTDTGVCQPIPAPGCPTGWNGVKHNCTTAYNTCEIQLSGVNNCGDSCGPVTITCYQPATTEIECQRCSDSYKWSCANWMSGSDGQCGTGDDAYGSATYSCCCEANGCPLKGYTSGNTGPCEDSTTTPPFAQFDGGQTGWENCVDSCCVPTITSCNCSPDFTSNRGGGSRTENCTDDCGDSISSICYCALPSAPSCPIGTSTSNKGYGYYDEYCSATNNCGVNNCTDCWCNSGCTPTSCPAGTSEGGIYGFYRSYSCSNACGWSDDRDCYCSNQCTPDSCPLAYSSFNLGFGSLLYDDCYNACDEYNSRTCYCYECTPSVCSINTSETGSHGYYDTKSCNNPCGVGNDRDCYCDSSCTPNFCPADTSEDGTHGFYRTYNCTNACGEPNDRDCYCDSACTPPACSAVQDEVKEVNVLYGNNDIKNCFNDCDEPKSRDCWWVCERATCTNLYENWGFELELTDSCDSPPCEQLDNITVPIAPETVHPGCPSEEVKTCYYPNSDPTLVSIDVREMDPSYPEYTYSYTTDSYSGIEGIGLNNPVKVIAKYQDTDGFNDIEALYVWWSTSSAKDFITPTLLDESGTNSGRTENNSNFGVMIRRNSSGNWGDVYIPQVVDLTTDNYWTYADAHSMSINIKGSGGENIVEIDNITITETAPNTVRLEMDWVFETSMEQIDNGQYNLWGSVNDKVGFDPFDDNAIRTSNWVDSTENWNIDLVLPNANPFSISFENENTMRVRVTGNNNTDGMDLSTARLDACISGETDFKPLIVEEQNYNLQTCLDGFNENETLIKMSRGDLGANDSLLTTDSTLAVGIKKFDTTKLIDLNGNDGGTLTFYLSVMDYAGNFEQFGPVIQRLGDWAFVRDGFVYGRSGTRSESRELEDSLWTEDPLSQYSSEKADLTNHALLGGSGVNIYNELRLLVRTGVNSSFRAVEVEGIFDQSLFDNLVEAYLVKSNNTDFGVYPITTETIGGSLRNLTEVDHADNCTTEEYCILERTGNLTIDSGFVCDGKGLIVVNGNLIINPEFINPTENDACIILASGDIQITEGLANPGNPGYDTIQAFLIAKEKIIIDADTIGNGLYIEGGLIGLSDGGIENNRDVPFPYNNTNPVIAVKNKFVYGALGKAMFGSQVDIFKTELGFKPY